MLQLLLRDTSGNKVSGNQNKRKQETTHESLKRSAIERTTSAVLATTTVYIIYRRLAVAQCWIRDTTAFCSNVRACGIVGFWLGVTVEFLLHVFGLLFLTQTSAVKITAKMKQQHFLPFLINHDKPGALRGHWLTHRAIISHLWRNTLNSTSLCALLSSVVEPTP